MPLTAADLGSIPITIDHDSRNLAIVYGSLGTLIAFATLIFAVLSWLRSRKQKLATALRTSADIELQSNTSRDSDRIPQQSANTAVVNDSHNRPDATNFPVAAVSQCEHKFELDAVATALPRAHGIRLEPKSADVRYTSATAPDTDATTPRGF